jgi:plasmid stabilization system protein ParE
MPQGAWSPKRERQYEHIKESELESGRSEDRAEEIAARTVNKQRAEVGETKAARTTKRKGG